MKNDTYPFSNSFSAYQGYFAASTDGMKIVRAGETNGYLQTSADGGVTWTYRTNTTQNWAGVASSGDGQKLVAIACGGGSDGSYPYRSLRGLAPWTRPLPLLACSDQSL